MEDVQVNSSYEESNGTDAYGHAAPTYDATNDNIGGDDDDDLTLLLNQAMEAEEAATGEQNEGGSDHDDGDDSAQESGGDDRIEDDGDGADATTTAAEDGDVEAHLSTLRKSEAKKLGKKMYKKWKKLHKSMKDSGSSKKDKKHQKSSKKSESKSSSRKQKRSRNDEENDVDDEEPVAKKTRKSRSGGGGEKRAAKSRGKRAARSDEFDNDAMEGTAPVMDDDEAMQLTYAPTESFASRVARANGGIPKARTREMQKMNFTNEAKEVVRVMREARAQDEKDIVSKKPPLHRISIRPFVQEKCRRQYLMPFLISEGILEELSLWLYDRVRKMPGALDLRTAALDILLTFPIEGELKVSESRDGEDLDAFTGLTREDLLKTTLGKSINTLRLCSTETKENVSKAVTLLERFSRALSGGVSSERASEGAGGDSIRWKCKGNQNILSPFHSVQTATEAFQSKIIRPDPLDPLSYMRVPPFRAPKTYITNLSGNIGMEKHSSR